MVFLNGVFIPKNQAHISVLDRGFLFGDGIYEVIPVYNKKLFHLKKHLLRLQKSLDLVQIKNPYSSQKWSEILTELSGFSNQKNQSIYLQITRGIGTQRQHSFNAQNPTIYIHTQALAQKSKQALSKGFSAISTADIRWKRCNIKSISLLANVLYAQQASENKVEEVILHQNHSVTEGATSNVFMLKDETIFTHPKDQRILGGITRDLILEIAKTINLKVQQKAFSVQQMYSADEVWICSSTREIMPITLIDNQPINQAKVGSVWATMYDYYQQLKNG